MKQYIDKDIVKAEIERIEYETNYEPFTEEVLGKRKVCKDIKDFLDTLEVKEEVLDRNDKTKLMRKCVKTSYKRGYDMGVLQTTNKINHNIKVDLELNSFDATVCKIGNTYLKEMDRNAIVKALEPYKDGDKVKVIIKVQKGE